MVRKIVYAVFILSNKRKKMAIIFYLRNQAGNLVKDVDLIEDIELEFLTNKAKNKNLKCLSFIDSIGDTIINQLQIKELQRDINTLLDEPETNKEHLKAIYNATLEAQKNKSLYLLFNGE